VTQSYSRDGDSKRDNDADPMKTIRQYLTAHGCSSIDMDYLWRAEGKMVCVSFILRDKGIAIRYRDPNVVESLAATRKNVGDGQQQAWEAFAKEFRAGGGSVYSINTSGREQIITALDACQALRPQNSTATDSVMFAKK
jgi:hypothetical protein